MKASTIRTCGFIFVAGCLLFVGWLFFRPNELKSAAVQIVNAMRSGDSERLYEAMSDEERRCSNLSPEKLKQAWALLVEPQMKNSKFVRDEPALQTANDFQATAAIWFADSKGTPWRLVMIANKAEGSPKTTVLFHMLIVAWQFDDNGLVETKLGTGERYLNGIAKYRDRLEALGIHRVMLNPNRCVTWDELRDTLSRGKQKS